MTVAVRLRGFGHRHAGRKAWAVRGLDLAIERGERVALLGPSGAGKSTLLAALAGLDVPGEREGTLEVDGRAGIVFQDPAAQLVMVRSGDDVAFGLENLGTPADRIRPTVDEALARVGFPYGHDRPTHALSGGEQQRLALAGVLALGPSLLLLDEPTANLDPAGADEVRRALAAVPRDTTTVIVEHRVAELLPLLDRVVVLDAGGGVRAEGPPEKIFRAYGDQLAEDGVWVPGHPLPSYPPTAGPGAELLRTESLAHRHAGAFPDLAVRAAETLAVLGPNGAGKSTLALLLGGLLKPDAGRVVAAADPRPPHTWRASALAGRIGSVFQNPSQQFVTSRVREELALGGASADRVGELLERLRLARLAEAHPHTLSGGERRRLSVATALAAAPDLLVLDEPTFGQDRRTWSELAALLASLRDQGHGLVTVTHDPDFVTALGGREVRLTGAPTSSRAGGAR
ncbi:ABC transporter ATP-binding protein [Streptomyces sp. NPDC060194]|uniref:ABC transporter ATP-binding protein n=1 Tax=Streptomyces sp. NPDC060194 TaxID=3347069 RepID=UPI00365751C5